MTNTNMDASGTDNDVCGMDNDRIDQKSEGRANNASTAYLARAMKAIREGASIAGILRMAGAGLMVFSLSLFLMQGVDASSDLHRYLLLLGQTALLTGAGFAVGLLLKEPRGARVFFSLALISIPANFAVLGGMIYSITPLDTFITQYPTYASWQSTSIRELVIAGAAALAVLIPMAVFCFAVLARHASWWLSATYLGASALLLVPLRESLSTTVISSVCALAVVLILSRQHVKRSRRSTGEEQFARILLFVPAALMLGRSATLYSIDFHFALAIIITVYFMLRRVVTLQSEKPFLTTLVQVLTAICALMVAFMVTTLIGENFSFVAPLLLFSLVWLALNLDLVRFIDSARIRQLIHGSWAITNTLSVIIGTLIFSVTDGFTQNLAIAIVILVASTLTRQTLGAVLGAVTVLGVLAINGSHLFAFLVDTGWAGIAIAGAATIVSGSLLERFWPVLKLRLINQFSSKVRDSHTLVTSSAFESREAVYAKLHAGQQADRKAA